MPVEGQLSLRTEQHSRESTGRKVCVRYCLHPVLAGVAEEKHLGCVPWDSSMLQESCVNLAVWVWQCTLASELKASPHLKDYFSDYFSEYFFSDNFCLLVLCQAPRSEAHTILGALVCFPNIYQGIPRLGPISEAGESITGTADLKVKPHLL